MGLAQAALSFHQRGLGGPAPKFIRVDLLWFLGWLASAVNLNIVRLVAFFTAAETSPNGLVTWVSGFLGSEAVKGFSVAG